jgi:hypothetical protein
MPPKKNNVTNSGMGHHNQLKVLIFQNEKTQKRTKPQMAWPLGHKDNFSHYPRMQILLQTKGAMLFFIVIH